MIDSLPHQWMTEQRRSGHDICLVLDSQTERQTRQWLLKNCPFDQVRSVYAQTPVADLADAGPFIFRLDQRNDAAMNELLASPQRHWGWLVSIAKGELPQLVKHWQERLIMGAQPHQALYRFHDNRVLSRALEHLPVDAYPAYLGPAISVCYWQGARWASAHNPDPGLHPVPDQPLWHQVPVPAQQAMDIRLINARRYLLAEHTQAFARLAGQHDPEAWLRDRLRQAETWNWRAPEQLEFLLTESLKAPAFELPPHWQVRAGESPAEHFERVHREAEFWQGDASL